MGKIKPVSPAWDLIIENIKRIQKEKNLTGEGISLAAGVPANYLCRILNRKIKQPRAPVLMRIAEAMGVSLEDLTGGTEGCQVKLHERLRWLRESRGWERNELAEKTGIPRATIDDLENNQIANPRISLLRNLAAVFSVQLYDLLGEHSLEPTPLERREPNPVVQLRRVLAEMEQVHLDYEKEKITDRQLYARSARLVAQARQLARVVT